MGYRTERNQADDADLLRDVAFGDVLEHVGYGAWATEIDNREIDDADRRREFGASAVELTAGSTTSAAAVDARDDTATYTGRTTGFRRTLDGNDNLAMLEATSGVFSATVNFTAASDQVTYRATDTRVSGDLFDSTNRLGIAPVQDQPGNVTGLTFTAEAALDFNGSATIGDDGNFTAGSGGFMVGGNMDSSAELDGSFYGPEAQEMGGTFRANNGNYFGSFGADGGDPPAQGDNQ